MSLSTITLAGKDVTLVAMPATPGLRAVEFTAYDGVGMVRSPFSGKAQAQRWHGGDMWSGKATLPSMVQKDADNWIAFLEELRGKFCAFQMGDPLQTSPRGSGSGAPVVDNTQNGGNPAGSLFLGAQGWTPSATGVLLPGDYLQVGYRLYRNLNQVDADADGKAVLSIWPSLREVPTSDGTSAGWLNATGHDEITVSKSLGNTHYGAIFQDFAIPASILLPSDAVIQGIYPVLICSATHDGADSYFKFGTGLALSTPAIGTGFITPSDPTNETFAGTEFYGPSIGTSLSDLTGQEVMTQLSQSLFLSGLTDVIDITAVGYAIYYASATPITDLQMPAPFTVPSGQGVAWALPSAVTQTGVQPGGSGIFDPGSGKGLGTPAEYNGGIILDNPLGIFRLQQNNRDWAADFQRVTELSFPFQEYR